MGRSPHLSLLVAGIVATTLGVASAMHDPSITDAEFRCQTKTDRAQGKFVRRKSKCFQDCNRRAWSGRNPFSDCVPPYGGATLRCIQDPVAVRHPRGVENKLAESILEACDPATKPAAACPSCYAGGDCSAGPNGEASNRVQNIEGQFDSFGPALFCETTPATPGEQACQLTTAKALGKLAETVARCYASCYEQVHRGNGAAADCYPPARDPATAACVFAAADLSIATIDRRCRDVIDLSQLCSDWSRGGYPNGASWTNLVEIWFSGGVPIAYCTDE